MPKKLWVYLSGYCRNLFRVAGCLAAVSDPIGQPINKDAQTETTVKELLKEIDAKK